jgi:gamma-glutamyltranspeptidase/glutathione hydrolase
MGDTDFVHVPIDRLVSEAYIKSLVDSIKPGQATPSDALEPVVQPTGKGQDTTHFSIIDNDGNRVSATLSINYPFGSCFVARGTGVLLNDEMDDFVAKPGVPNVYGLVGSTANSIQPGKRMLSSMSPSFAETRDRFAILGTPGGSRIITMVLLAMLDFYEGKSVDQMVNDGRYHHQYLPDQIQYEPGVLDDKTVKSLQKMGYKLKALDSTYGNMQAIVVNKENGVVDAASDKRGIGAAWVGADQDSANGISEELNPDIKAR